MNRRPTHNQSANNSRAVQRPPRPNERTKQTPSPPAQPGDFHNPYNFIPTPSRAKTDGELGHHHPKGHGTYHDDHWSGRLAITITTQTPLLIPDAANATTDSADHKTFPMRCVNGKPYLAPTSLKGMLRSAFEAVTNSRFGVFEAHSDRLAYRMPANQGLSMVPARIENGRISLYTGTSAISASGKPQGAMYAAWLPRYDRRTGNIANWAIRYRNGALPQHGQAVSAWIEECGKYRRDGRGPIFSYWKIREIVHAGQNLRSSPQPSPTRGTHAPTGRPMKLIQGYVCITRRNINTKHDERIFFSDQLPQQIDLTDGLRERWQQLINNYRTTHETEIVSGRQGPPALENSVWSRHITSITDQERDLADGTLCYASVRNEGNRITVHDLYPVMISRKLYESSPATFLSKKLLPPKRLDDLSPADRVFGWVNPNGKGSYKGNLRIHSVTCSTPDPIETFGTPMTLAILGKPNPQQFRFYLADENNAPVSPEVKPPKAYTNGQALRGRKVYPHHRALPQSAWTPAEASEQEYTHTERSNQNRSVEQWVKPGVTFSAHIDVTNLSQAELGALLWLLTLPDGHFHRLGYGKPLGFGSVRLTLNEAETDLKDGQQWRNYYSSLLPSEPPTCDIAAAIDAYKIAVREFHGVNFNDASFIKAFLKMTTGFEDGKPIHYPRTAPGDEGFKWFEENNKERTNRQPGGQHLPLPLLIDDQGLPYNPASQPPIQPQPGPQNRRDGQPERPRRRDR